MSFRARVVKDSITERGHRITTMEWRYPRAIHSELMTHRVLSRNAASSRAIPIQKMISNVWNSPFQPVWWGRNQSGMQAKEELVGWRLWLAKHVWHIASRVECLFVWILFKIGLHKQIANRRLECDGWITVIITATEWSNLFALRTHPDAQPEFQRIATLAKLHYDASVPALLQPGEWHLPLVEDLEKLKTEGYTIDEIVSICVGRCARVSYLTHDGKRDPRADIELALRLQNSGHMSPLEHAAQAPAGDLDAPFDVVRSGNFEGWVQYRKTVAYEADFGSRPKV